jgi:hypothetical protein
VVSDSAVPTIIDIQDQINSYVVAHIDECLDNFTAFSEMGYVVEVIEPAQARTIIGRDDVKVYLNYPMRAEIDDKSARLSNFPVTLQLGFLEIYNLALSIAYAELDYQYLETIMVQLISTYSDLDPNKLPPIVATDEGFDTVIWSKQATRQRLESLMKSHVPFIQVENTRNYEPLHENSLNSMYRLFTLSNNKTYNSISVDFTYLDWPIYMDITPSEGDLLMPQSHKRSFPFDIAPSTQTNYYEFFYDVAVPVIVEVRDYSAFGGRGYSFLYAMEGNIMDNKNLALWHMGEGTFGPLDYTKVQYGFGGGISQTPARVYIPETDTYINTTVKQPEKKLFCDNNQRISDIIDVEVLDSSSLEPVHGADVTFGCGKYSACSLGTTGAQGKYSSRFPICIGEGFVRIEKEGYATKVRSGISVRPDAKLKLRMKIDPLVRLNTNIRTIDANSLHGQLTEAQAWEIKNEARKMDDGTQAFISFTKIKEDPFEPDYNQILFLMNNQTQDLVLSEGRYTVEANLIDLEGEQESE